MNTWRQKSPGPRREIIQRTAECQAYFLACVPRRLNTQRTFHFAQSGSQMNRHGAVATPRVLDTQRCCRSDPAQGGQTQWLKPFLKAPPENLARPAGDKTRSQVARGNHKYECAGLEYMPA